jgi:CarD family transcriptional regulator
MIFNGNKPFLIWYNNLNKSRTFFWRTRPFFGQVFFFKESSMAYQIGDKVIHSSFGFSEIIGIENKEISGKQQPYYVVKTKDMLIWIPVAENPSGKLRLPSTQKELHDCFIILRSKYDPLSTDRSTRKSSIHTRYTVGTITSLCELIRDLSFYKVQNKINEYEKSILDRAILVLIDEWGFSFNIPAAQARSELNRLLGESYAISS